MPAADPVLLCLPRTCLAWPGDGLPVAHSSRIVLRRLRSSDAAIIRRWNRDLLLTDLYGGRASDLALEANGYVLGIELAGSEDTPGRLLGLIGLTGETWGMGSAELRVLLGERADWAQGYGREAIATFIDHILAASNLDFLYLRVFRRNVRAMRCYEACGFRRSGRLRVCSDHRYSTPPPEDDLVLMTFTRAGTARSACPPAASPAAASDD